MIGKILIVDDVSSNRIVFKVKLTAAGYQTIASADGEGALRLALVERPDIILLNLSLGVGALQMLKAHPQTRRIPVIVVAAQAQASQRLEALRCGAEDFITRPMDDQTLQARLRAVMRMRQALAGVGGANDQTLGLLGLAEPAQPFALPGLVAIVLPQVDRALRLRRDLGAMGQDRFVIMAAEEVHTTPLGSAPDVYMIHADLGGSGGGLRMAVYDPLTGLHNRRYGMAQLTAIADRAGVSVNEFAVLVVDIDRFKSVNDRWGHAAGDAVLVEVARRLSLCLRPLDLLARIGGEEFLIALPATSLADAQQVAQGLCRAVDGSAIALGDGTRVEVTISIGMTTGGGGPSDPVQASELVAQADRALMHSKAHGRNQVTIVRRAA